MIDPGHGGIDGGAYFNNVKESTINLQLSMFLKADLEKKGYTVILTRDGDYDLSSDNSNRKRTDALKRIEIIEKSNCDLFVSIHQNSFQNKIYRGSQTFYSSNNIHNERLAKTVLESIKSTLNNTTRKAKKIDNIFILDNVKTCGILIEGGFLSNPIDFHNLLDDAYLEKLAFAISYGITSFLT